MPLLLYLGLVVLSTAVIWQGSFMLEKSAERLLPPLLNQHRTVESASRL
ncbi:MAG: hypothetical protein AB1589_42060 [Cyanobacteriota bacterium]